MNENYCSIIQIYILSISMHIPCKKKLLFLQLLRSSEAAEKLRKSFIKASGIGTCGKAGFYAGLQKSRGRWTMYDVWRMDNGASLYYKLTYEPKGSGELKIQGVTLGWGTSRQRLPKTCVTKLSNKRKILWIFCLKMESRGKTIHNGTQTHAGQLEQSKFSEIWLNFQMQKFLCPHEKVEWIWLAVNATLCISNRQPFLTFSYTN